MNEDSIRDRELTRHLDAMFGEIREPDPDLLRDEKQQAIFDAINAGDVRKVSTLIHPTLYAEPEGD